MLLRESLRRLPRIGCEVLDPSAVLTLHPGRALSSAAIAFLGRRILADAQTHGFSTERFHILPPTTLSAGADTGGDGTPTAPLALPSIVVDLSQSPLILAPFSVLSHWCLVVIQPRRPRGTVTIHAMLNRPSAPSSTASPPPACAGFAGVVWECPSGSGSCGATRYSGSV